MNVSKLLRVIRTPLVRAIVLFGLDTTAWALGLTAAVAARYEFDYSNIDWPALAVVIGCAALAQLVWGVAVGLYPGRWRLGSANEALALIGGSLLIGLGIGITLMSIPRPRPVPVSIASGAAIFVIGALGARIIVRIIRDTHGNTRQVRHRRAIFFGAGEAGHDAARAMLRDPASDVLPVAFLDDDPTKHRLRVQGRPVVGTRSDLAAAAAAHEADLLVITMPSATRAQIGDVAREARKIGLDVFILPTVAESLAAPNAGRAIRPLRFGDFLGREPVNLDRDAMAALIRNRRVLVTGAGGSIGSELCRAIDALRPGSLAMLDRDENGLHRTQLRLEGRAMLDTDDLIVADIRDQATLERVFSRHRPEIVFHAAALKHVSLLEMHPAEAFKTNVLGTNNLLQTAARHGVEHFVNVSTDKAADPVNVLGLTKRIGEMLAAGYPTSEMTAISVRFGNVLGSSGSVIPTLTAQIEAGGPITITDPAVTRYFMTIEEAVQLVLQAGAVGTSGQVLVLDMGEPVRIVDLARELVAEIAPGADIEVVYTGLRPGEKLHEVLAGPADQRLGKPHEGLTSYAVPPMSPAVVESLDLDDTVKLKERLQWIVSEFSAPRAPRMSEASDDRA